jgi:hypothetical protein
MGLIYAQITSGGKRHDGDELPGAVLLSGSRVRTTTVLDTERPQGRPLDVGEQVSSAMARRAELRFSAPARLK